MAPPRVARRHPRRSLSLDPAGRPNTAWASQNPSEENQERQTRSSTHLWESPDSTRQGYALVSEAATPEGFTAKCAMVATSSFDDSDLLTIAWRLGYEAGRL